MIQFAYMFGIGIFTQDVAFWKWFSFEPLAWIRSSTQISTTHTLHVCWKEGILIFDTVRPQGTTLFIFFFIHMKRVYLLPLHALHHKKPFLDMFLFLYCVCRHERRLKCNKTTSYHLLIQTVENGFFSLHITLLNKF